ncbi:MAG: hypothetical protein ACRDRG_19690 [Pseudonocardiaceae bacterium]
MHHARGKPSTLFGSPVIAAGTRRPPPPPVIGPDNQPIPGFQPRPMGATGGGPTSSTLVITKDDGGPFGS